MHALIKRVYWPYLLVFGNVEKHVERSVSLKAKSLQLSKDADLGCFNDMILYHFEIWLNSCSLSLLINEPLRISCWSSIYLFFLCRDCGIQQTRLLFMWRERELTSIHFNLQAADDFLKKYILSCWSCGLCAPNILGNAKEHTHSTNYAPGP